MEAISRISSPFTESWVTWLLLLLLAIGISNQMFLTEITIVFRSLFSRGERTYTNNENKIQYITWLYQICIVSLIVYLWLAQDGFEIVDYGIIVGILGGTYLVQWIVIKFVAHVFLLHRQISAALEQRNLINNAISGIMLPLSFMMIWQGNRMNTILIAGLAILYLGLIVVKSVQLFYNNATSILYVTLYILSLEVVPITCAIFWIKNILQ